MTPNTRNEIDAFKRAVERNHHVTPHAKARLHEVVKAPLR